MEEIKQELKEGILWILADGSRDAMGREVVHVLVGKLDKEQYQPPFLVHVDFVEKSDGDSMAR